jgi:gamma-glutamyltranspeptidase/glutathione hydrolase/leukotriene-C4 hydrolase
VAAVKKFFDVFSCSIVAKLNVFVLLFYYSFGAKIRSYKTGIVYNNHMSTFSLPKTTKSYQPKPSKANYIEPGKRSVSTACPTIVVDKDGSVKMVVGGSGALRITSGVPMVRNLVLFNL